MQDKEREELLKQISKILNEILSLEHDDLYGEAKILGKKKATKALLSLIESRESKQAELVRDLG